MLRKCFDQQMFLWGMGTHTGWLSETPGETSDWFLPGASISYCCGTNAKLFLPLQHSFSAVMHFAGLKAVGESVQKPLEYYRVNLTGTIRLLEVSRAGRLRVVLGATRVLGDWCWV